MKNTKKASCFKWSLIISIAWLGALETTAGVFSSMSLEGELITATDVIKSIALIAA